MVLVLAGWMLLGGFAGQAHAQLSRVGATISAAFAPTARGTDIAYDSANQVYLMVGAANDGSIRAVFLNTSGAVTQSYLVFAGGGNTGEWAQFPRAEFSPHANNGKGAFLVAWHSLGRILVSMVSTTDGVLTSAQPISGTSTWEEIGPSIAYSETSQVFLLAWQTKNFGIEARFLNTSGSPITTVKTFANDFTARDASVAWNPTTNQFGFGYSGFGGSGAFVRFRISDLDGNLSGGHTTGYTGIGTYNTDMAVNPSTGNYVFVWAQPAGLGSSFLEMSAAGNALNEGLISTQMGDTTSLGIDFSPVSGTFLAVGQSAQSYNASAVELNPRGVPLTAAIVVTDGGESIGTYYPRVVARRGGAPQWMMSFSRKFQEMAGQIVQTTSNFGCSFSLSSSSASVGAGGGSASGTLTASSASCQWTSSSNAAWLTVSPTSGTGATSYSLSVTATANPTFVPRTGILTIGGRTFTVTQAAQSPCSYVVSPPSHIFSGSGGTVSFGVTTTTGCAWSANVSASWLEVVSVDGSSGSGTVRLRARANSTPAARNATVTIANVVVSISQRKSSPGDTNGDGMPDLLWRNISDGGIAVWTLSGTNLLSSDMLSHSVPDQNWKIEAAMDHDEDGDVDLIWRHQLSGDLAVWVLNGRTLVDSQSLVPGRVTDLNWKIVGSGDFNGDGKPDLFWQNTVTGDLAVWYMNGRTLIDSVSASHRVPDLAWKIVAVADMDGDGDADLIWRNTSTGELAAWFMNGKTLVDSQYLSVQTVHDQNWKIVASGDYNGDGHTDLMWQNDGTGELAAWFMNGRVLLDSVAFNPGRVLDLNWKIVGRK